MNSLLLFFAFFDLFSVTLKNIIPSAQNWTCPCPRSKPQLSIRMNVFQSARWLHVSQDLKHLSATVLLLRRSVLQWSKWLLKALHLFSGIWVVLLIKQDRASDHSSMTLFTPVPYKLAVFMENPGERRHSYSQGNAASGRLVQTSVGTDSSIRNARQTKLSCQSSQSSSQWEDGEVTLVECHKVHFQSCALPALFWIQTRPRAKFR